MKVDNIDSTVTVIKAGLLIPGRGDPIKAAAVVIEAGKLKYVGLAIDLPSTYQSYPTIKVPYLMPGLWDCHCHLFGTTTLSAEAAIQTPQSLAGAYVARDMVVILRAGFTSVRDVGGYGCEISKGVNQGILLGPNIYSAGAIISQTGGHGDTHGLLIKHVHDYCNHGNGVPICLADGRDECRIAVRKQLRRGASLIKICTSGGVLSLSDDPRHQQFSEEELEVIVEEASRAHRIVAAHAHGKPGIMAALRAGCKTVEHGTWGDDESFALMKEKDAILVPTRTVVAAGVQMGQKMLPPESVVKMQLIADVHRSMYAKAVQSGVRIALGADLLSSLPGTPVSNGLNGLEVVYAVEAGMTPLQAIECCTANGPLTLGRQAPKSGIIQEGYDADLIALMEDPLKEIKVLAEPEKITHVWKGGKLVKKPGDSGCI